MTKYFMILALLMLMGCEKDPNKTPVDDQPDIDTTLAWTSYAGLEWSPRSENAMTWQEALDYCEAMGARLPTINELRKIIINCPGSTYGGACQASDPDCLDSECWKSEDCYCDGTAASYSALGDGNIWLWSSSPHANSDYAWFVGFDHGNVNGIKKYYNSLARCVR